MNHNIFIADDDDQVLNAYKGIFSPADNHLNFFDKKSVGVEFKAQYFKDGQLLYDEFISSYKKNIPIPVCILDMRMPNLSGLETAVLLRKIDPHVQILIITAYSDVSINEIKAQLNFNVFFQHKPFEKEELLSKVESLVQIWNNLESLKNKNKELAQAHKKSNLILESSDLGYWDWNFKTNQVHVNPKWRDLVFYGGNFLTPSLDLWKSKIHPDDLANMVYHINGYLDGDFSTYECEYRVLNNKQEWCWVLDRGAVSETDLNENPIRMCGTLMDIHARKLKDEEFEAHRLELADQNLFFQKLLTNINDIIFKLDMHGKILNCWAQNNSLLSVPPELFIGKTLHEVFGEKQATPFMTALVDCVMHQKRISIDYSLDLNHKKEWFCAHFQQIDETRILVQVDSITARKELEEELRLKSEQAEIASKAKSMFLSTMSHEIRTPLNGIIGISNLLNSMQLNAEQSDLVHLLKNSSEILLYLVNDILDYSKIEAGQMTLESIPVSPHELIKDASSLLQNSLLEKKLNLIQNIPENQCDFMGDPIRIRQILLNFMSNAIKFTSVGSIQLKIFEVKEYLRFEVIDSGIGLTLAQQEKLFSAFTQADTSTTRNFGGTGLGLSICKRLVELMGGKIGVVSEINQGSCFWFEIPYQKAEKSKVNTHHTTSSLDQSFALKHPFKILLVDDNAINRKVADLLLQKLGYKIDLAESGTQALKMQESIYYDLVFMDMQMPEMDGCEATRHWRAHEQKLNRSPISIVALTANVSLEDKIICDEAGMTGFLSKPIQLKGLADVLSQASSSQIVF